VQFERLLFAGSLSYTKLRTMKYLILNWTWQC